VVPPTQRQSVHGLLLERCQSRLVESCRSMFLNLMAKSMWVVFHPHEQGRSGFVRVGASGRAGLDPLADEIPVELPEAAAGVI